MKPLPMTKEECEAWLTCHQESADRVMTQLAIDHAKTREKLFHAMQLIRALSYDPGHRHWFITDRTIAAEGLRHVISEVP